jgi:serine/threonine-protein kinase HipA
MNQPATHRKTLPGHLLVHIDRPDGVHHVGELVIDDQAPGGFAAKFRYAPEWIANGFALDPLNLPLKAGWVETLSKHVKLGVLFDAGPDLWGRRVLQSQTRHRSRHAPLGESDILLMGRGNGVGALLFSDSPALTRADLPSFQTLPTIERDLLRVHRAVHHVFSKDPMPEALEGLLAGSWSMGGARAKAVMRSEATGDIPSDIHSDNDRGMQGGIWIAKFSEPGEVHDRQRMEKANLDMAVEIGMKVPVSRIVDTELGSVLLIQRFDRTHDLQRIHFASGSALVSAEPEDKRFSSLADQTTFSYAKLADILAQVSSDPGHARAEVFARMVFNICVCNTDDHLKNIGFIEKVVNGRTYMDLAPVFDVVTQQTAQHYLHIGQQGRVGSLESAMTGIRRFRLTATGAQSIIERVTNVVSRRGDFYRAVGLGDDAIEMLNGLIGQRCPLADEMPIDGEVFGPSDWPGPSGA